MGLRPRLKGYLPTVLHETLGTALPSGAKATAVLWGACQIFVQRHPAAMRRAGIENEEAGIGEALFRRILTSPSGTVIATHTEEEMWSWMRHRDGKIRLVIPEMLNEFNSLESSSPVSSEFPFVLLAGERRSFNANKILRDQAWRRRDQNGALKLNPEDERIPEPR